MRRVGPEQPTRELVAEPGFAWRGHWEPACRPGAYPGSRRRGFQGRLRRREKL